MKLQNHIKHKLEQFTGGHLLVTSRPLLKAQLTTLDLVSQGLIWLNFGCLQEWRSHTAYIIINIQHCFLSLLRFSKTGWLDLSSSSEGSSSIQLFFVGRLHLTPTGFRPETFSRHVLWTQFAFLPIFLYFCLWPSVMPLDQDRVSQTKLAWDFLFIYF